MLVAWELFMSVEDAFFIPLYWGRSWRVENALCFEYIDPAVRLILFIYYCAISED